MLGIFMWPQDRLSLGSDDIVGGLERVQVFVVVGGLRQTSHFITPSTSNSYITSASLDTGRPNDRHQEDSAM